MRELYNALDVACFIVNYCNYNKMGVTNNRLQRLLYFVQAYSFAKYNREFFHNDIEAWLSGPTVPDVRDEFAFYTGNDIGVTNEYLKYNFKTELYEKVNYSEDVFSSDAKRLIQEVIEYFKDYSDFELLDLALKQSPWINASERGRMAKITTQDMSERFYKEVKEAKTMFRFEEEVDLEEDIKYKGRFVIGRILSDMSDYINDYHRIEMQSSHRTIISERKGLLEVNGVKIHFTIEDGSWITVAYRSEDGRDFSSSTSCYADMRDALRRIIRHCDSYWFQDV